MNKPSFLFLGIVSVIISISSCRDSDKPSAKDIVKKAELLEDRIRQNLTVTLAYAMANQGKINDTLQVSQAPLLRSVYEKNGFSSIWSYKGKWNSTGDSLFNFIKNSKEHGLFPADYYYGTLAVVDSLLKRDSMANKDAALLSRADIIMTQALFHVSRDLKRGRLPYDSLTLRKDTIVINDSFYLAVLDSVTQTKRVASTLVELEPTLPGYRALKESIKGFVDTTEFRKFTYLNFPFNDSLQFYDRLKKRLLEENIFDSLPTPMDSLAWRNAITKYQASKKLKTTGRINENTVKRLNNTPWERFKRIAISLDKYKLMVDTMPTNYAWVNIPGYYLKVIENDSVAVESKIIVGTSKTRTPELYSEISNFITYPQWTVPYSIIFKEMLPQIQKDTNYLKKQNLMVVDKNDSVIPPSKINWKKLSKTYFPYLIRQRQGDDNSLGVLKFNFRNKYSVYLHDTNARWMFSKSDRALSHGCVRVQNWEQLAHYLVRNDTIKYPVDTLISWIVRQEKHVVSGFKKLPLFIRYFTVEGVDGRVKFYEDIYAEDKILAEKYFSKNIY